MDKSRKGTALYRKMKQQAYRKIIERGLSPSSNKFYKEWMALTTKLISDDAKKAKFY